MESLIKSDNTWLLWTFLVVWAAISIVLEQKYKWASKITGAIIALLGAIIFANLVRWRLKIVCAEHLYVYVLE
jgi:uncharacterized membrane protein